MIEHCRREALAAHLSGKTEFIRTDLIDYVPPKRFHVCIGIGLFDYISDPLPVLNKMNTCALDCAIMSFPRRWTWRAPIRKTRLVLRGCNVRFFTRRQIDALLIAAGFTGYSIEKVGKLFCVSARVK
jgi:hypothetical protein